MKSLKPLAATLCSAVLLASFWSGPAFASGPAQMSGLLVDNYWGQPMTLTIADAQYTVPADGQQFIALSPGVYDLSANVNGKDASAENAEIDIQAGQDLQMSYARSGTFFQPVAAGAPAPVTAASPLPAQSAPPAVVPNTDISSAAALDSQPHTIGPNQSLWYRLDLAAGTDREAVLSIAHGANLGLRMDLFSSSQFDEWWECPPEGVGAPDDSSNLTWASGVDMNSTWYVRVMNNGAQSATFQFSLSGPILAN